MVGFSLTSRWVLLLFSVAIVGLSQESSPAAIKDADKATFEKVCGSCHLPAMANTFKFESDWRSTISNMVDMGAQASEEEVNRVLRYLKRTWTRININSATQKVIVDVIGVSDSIAKKIVDYRSANGNFKDCNDLIKALDQVGLAESCKERIVF